MIVEAFDPVNDVEAGLGTGFVPELIDAFDLQRLEEALHRGIVPAVGPAAHRLQHSEILDQSSVAITRVLGEFNPSSQHFLIGGVDGYKKVGSGSSRTCKDAVARATSRAASIRAAAVLAGDRRWMLKRGGSAVGGSVAGGWGQMVSGVWRYAAIASCAVVTAGIGTILVVG
jgi:hypothetical protein